MADANNLPATGLPGDYFNREEAEKGRTIALPEPGHLWFVATEASGRVMAEVVAERMRQDAKWGVQTHPDMRVYISILTEEVGEAAQAANDYEVEANSGLEQLRLECVQVAAVAVKIVEAIDRKRAGVS